MANKKGKISKQKNLPGMADRKIVEIENAAISYAEARDERISLMKPEKDAKDALMKAMHKAGKKTYQRGNISVTLVVEKENVKVRVKAEGSEVDGVDDEELTDEDVEVGVGA
jgi:hypothetical protein